MEGSDSAHTSTSGPNTFTSSHIKEFLKCLINYLSHATIAIFNTFNTLYVTVEYVVTKDKAVTWGFLG